MERNYSQSTQQIARDRLFLAIILYSCLTDFANKGCSKRVKTRTCGGCLRVRYARPRLLRHWDQTRCGWREHRAERFSRVGVQQQSVPRELSSVFCLFFANDRHFKLTYLSLPEVGRIHWLSRLPFDLIKLLPIRLQRRSSRYSNKTQNERILI